MEERHKIDAATEHRRDKIYRDSKDTAEELRAYFAGVSDEVMPKRRHAVPRRSVF